MPSSQILYLMIFVGKCSCTSHVLQYSSSRSYEHSRSLQSILCPGVVTVLICSFFVAALLLIYINLKNGGKIIHIFTNNQTFSYLFCIFTQYFPSFYLLSHKFFVILHSKASRFQEIELSFCFMKDNSLICEISAKNRVISWILRRKLLFLQKIHKSTNYWFKSSSNLIT